MNQLRFALCAAAGATAFMTVAAAAADGPYYANKVIEVSVDRGSGGSQDQICRFMATHLADHIAGKPKFVVRNRPGGTGVVATNWLYNQAPQDGTAIGCFMPVRFYQDAFWGSGGKSLGLKADVKKLIPVAGASVISVTYVRADIGKGIRGPADIKNAPAFKTGGQSASSTKDIGFRTVFDLAGIKYKYVTGYQDSADAWAAVLRNEVQHHQSGVPHYMSVVMPTGVQAGTVVPLFYDGTKRIAELAPAVPASEFIAINGGKAEGPLWDLYRTSIAWRAFFMPPGAPEAASAAFESGFERMLNDPAFRKAYKSQYQLEPEWIAGRKQVDAEMVAPYRSGGSDLAEFKKALIDKVKKK